MILSALVLALPLAVAGPAAQDTTSTPEACTDAVTIYATARDYDAMGDFIGGVAPQALEPIHGSSMAVLLGIEHSEDPLVTLTAEDWQRWTALAIELPLEVRTDMSRTARGQRILASTRSDSNRETLWKCLSAPLR